jgi:hypothetical protein
MVARETSNLEAVGYDVLRCFRLWCLTKYIVRVPLRVLQAFFLVRTVFIIFFVHSKDSFLTATCKRSSNAGRKNDTPSYG